MRGRHGVQLTQQCPGNVCTIPGRGTTSNLGALAMQDHRITLTCPRCWQCFLVLPCEARKGRRFCSRDCAFNASRGKPRRPTLDRFWSKVDRNGPLPDYAPNLGPCWVWIAKTVARGYGAMRVADKKVMAHRFAYETCIGPIPRGLHLDHLCRVPRCVNPNHLEPVSAYVNWERGQSPSRLVQGAETCKRGHAWNEANTYRPSYRPGARFCRVCNREARARLKAARAMRPAL